MQATYITGLLDTPFMSKRTTKGAVRPTATSLRLTQLSLGCGVSSGHERLPLCQSGRAVGLVGLAIGEVAVCGEVVVKRSMD